MGSTFEYNLYICSGFSKTNHNKDVSIIFMYISILLKNIQFYTVLYLFKIDIKELKYML